MTTDIKPEMLSGVQTRNGTPHDKYNIRCIAHARTNRKDNIFMQRRLGQIFTCILEWRQGTCKKSRQYPAQAYYTTLVVLVFDVVLHYQYLMFVLPSAVNAWVILNGRTFCNKLILFGG